LVALVAIRRTERVPERPGTHLRERARQRRLDDVLLELRVVLKLRLERVDAVLRDLELAHDRQPGRARRDTAGEARSFFVALGDESLAEVRRLDDSSPTLPPGDPFVVDVRLRRPVAGVDLPRGAAHHP